MMQPQAIGADPSYLFLKTKCPKSQKKRKTKLKKRKREKTSKNSVAHWHGTINQSINQKKVTFSVK